MQGAQIGVRIRSGETSRGEILLSLQGAAEGLQDLASKIQAGQLLRFSAMRGVPQNSQGIRMFLQPEIRESQVVVRFKEIWIILDTSVEHLSRVRIEFPLGQPDANFQKKVRIHLGLLE